MNPTDKLLGRLLDAAAKAQPEASTTAPLGLETRVLAHWRAPVPDDDAFLLAFLRRAMVGASLVLLLSTAWSLTRPSPSVPGEEAAVLDYDIQMSLNP